MATTGETYWPPPVNPHWPLTITTAHPRGPMGDPTNRPARRAPAIAVSAPCGRRGDPHRPVAAVGPGRSAARGAGRKSRRRDAAGLANRRRRAGFPTGKTFDSWDTDASSVPTATEQALRSLEWIRRAENLAVAGPSGTGKSHLLEALGHAAVDDRLTVTWFNIQDLGQLVRRHRVDDSVDKAIQRVIRADLIVIDDIGLLAGARRRRRSAAFASSTPPTNAARSL